MPQPNDLSRSLVPLDQDTTRIAVVELSQSSWLVGGVLPGIERQPRKKLEPRPERLLALLHRWRDESVRAGRTFNAGEDAANQPARLAHLDDGNDRAILVQGHEGPAQIVRLGHRGTPSIDVSDEIAIFAARPIASLCWRKPDSNHPSHSDPTPQSAAQIRECLVRRPAC